MGWTTSQYIHPGFWAKARINNHDGSWEILMAERPENREY